jgi:putative ABC transport system permease protein
LLGVLIISLGIGASTAIFSLIDGVLLNPLPFRNSARLAVVWSDFSRLRGYSRALTAPALFFDWRERSRSFAGMAAFVNSNRTFTSFDQPITPFTHEVTPNFFDVAGVQAFRGRTFLRDEGLPGKDGVALISYSLWRSAFGGSESTVNSYVELDGQSVRIVGVLPPGYRPPNNGITVTTGSFRAGFVREPAHGACGSLDGGHRPIARWRFIGASARRDRGDHRPNRTRKFRRNHPAQRRRECDSRRHDEPIPAAFLPAPIRGGHHAADRLRERRESAAGAILGPRIRVFRTHRDRRFAPADCAAVPRRSLVLSSMGAIGGILFAAWCLRPMLSLAPAAAGLPFADQVHVSPQALAFALGLSLLCAVFFGLAPARQASRAIAADHLGGLGRSRSAGRSSAVWRNALIAGEIGLSLILLASAGLLVQTFLHLSKQSWGFEPANVLTIRNVLRGESYRTASAQRNHFDAALCKLREIPGVESVSAISFPPPLAPFAPSPFVISGQPADLGHDPRASVLSVMPGYFETLGTRIVSGRSISEADTADSAPVAVISQSVVKRYFPKGDPVGQSFRMNGMDRRDWRIVGVAQDIRPGSYRRGVRRSLSPSLAAARGCHEFCDPHAYRSHGDRKYRGALSLEPRKADERIPGRASRRAPVR